MLTDDTGSTHIVRLLSFLDGQIFANVPYTPDLLYQAGKFIGGIERTLQVKAINLPSYKMFYFILLIK